MAEVHTIEGFKVDLTASRRQRYPGAAGLNLAEFIERLWYHEVGITLLHTKWTGDGNTRTVTVTKQVPANYPGTPGLAPEPGEAL
jgi:hypothetical protein